MWMDVRIAGKYVDNEYENLLEWLLPLRGFGGLVVVVEAARDSDVLAPSHVRRAVASFAVTANVALHFV